MQAPEQDSRVHDRAFRRLRRHILVYAAVNGALFLINLLTPGPLWFLWPMFGWGFALAAHWLYFKSVNIDDDWAQRRTEDIRLQAHDLGHIEDIAKRYEQAEAALEAKVKAGLTVPDFVQDLLGSGRVRRLD